MCRSSVAVAGKDDGGTGKGGLVLSALANLIFEPFGSWASYDGQHHFDEFGELYQGALHQGTAVDWGLG